MKTLNVSPFVFRLISWLDWSVWLFGDQHNGMKAFILLLPLRFTSLSHKKHCGSWTPPALLCAKAKRQLKCPAGTEINITCVVFHKNCSFLPLHFPTKSAEWRL